jgi:hypothetical protein
MTTSPTLATGPSQYLIDQWLNTLGNVPFVVPQVYWQLHLLIPGGEGTNGVSQTTLRVPATFAPAAAGSFNFTGIPPVWPIAYTETSPILAISGWDAQAPGTGNFLLSGTLQAPRPVAAGDQFALAGFVMNAVGMASD